MKINEDERIIFSTGREVYANKGIIGIDSDLSLTYGYDGDFEGDSLSNEEKLEIANFMITRWLQFKLSLPANKFNGV